ncbi:MAG TPA: hypothetical protein VKV26_24945 [Dehalococcoidia bacterium]|nr:hypothetical protein [Dehalococcoidia bacterium]
MAADDLVDLPALWESWTCPGAGAEALSGFTARFGQAALDLCAATVHRMAHEPELIARVRRRHELLGVQYLELGAASTAATAGAAGQRGMLVALLLESDARFFAA